MLPAKDLLPLLQDMDQTPTSRCCLQSSGGVSNCRTQSLYIAAGHAAEPEGLLLSQVLFSASLTCDQSFTFLQDVEQSQKHSMLVVSEFVGCSPSVSGAIRVNPWSVDSVADGIYSAIKMPQADRHMRHEKHWRYVSSHTAAFWARVGAHCHLLTQFGLHVPAAVSAVHSPSRLHEKHSCLVSFHMAALWAGVGAVQLWHRLQLACADYCCCEFWQRRCPFGPGLVLCESSWMHPGSLLPGCCWHAAGLCTGPASVPGNWKYWATSCIT